MNNYTVKRVGIVAFKLQPWLYASFDLIVIDDGRILQLVDKL